MIVLSHVLDKIIKCQIIFITMLESDRGRIYHQFFFFSLFLNDLVEFMSDGFDGLPDITEAIHLLCEYDDVEVYFKLYLLLYADDTVILAESQDQLQAALNSMYLFCQTWKLEVNSAKTKVVIFAKRNVKENPVFTYNGENIAVVDDFVYLGVTFTHNDYFTKH